MLSDQWLPTVGCARRFGGGARDRSADEIGGARAGQELAGIFKIVGYNSVGKDSNGRNRVEFDLVASDAKLSKSLAGRVVQGNIRGHSSEYLDARTVRGAE